MDIVLYEIVHIFGKPMELKWSDLYVQDIGNLEVTQDELITQNIISGIVFP